MENFDSFEGNTSIYGTQDPSIRAVLDVCGFGGSEEDSPPTGQQETPAAEFLSPATDEPSTERKGHCCDWDCCCREPGLWGKGYCSCGLLKWYCSGRHRCMHLPDEDPTGSDHEPRVWKTFRLFSTCWKNSFVSDPSPPAFWSRGEGNDCSARRKRCGEGTFCEEYLCTGNCHCSAAWSQSNSGNAHSASAEEPESEEEWGPIREWWSQEWRSELASAERWRHLGDWNIDDECSDEECTCDEVFSCNEECGCNEDCDVSGKCVVNTTTASAVEIYSVEPQDDCEEGLPRDGHETDLNKATLSCP
ncbi:uncharacterized protein [Ambystoma mexicanum]|uniref:uncharacterized protein n=1 Tax=Ambystoma mexicanum TaxID=8296 RepID=UPI0037E9A0B3